MQTHELQTSCSQAIPNLTSTSQAFHNALRSLAMDKRNSPVDGHMITDFRCKLNLSQRGLADLVGVHFNTIGKAENGGAISLVCQEKIAKVMEVDVDVLKGARKGISEAPNNKIHKNQSSVRATITERLDLETNECNCPSEFSNWIFRETLRDSRPELAYEDLFQIGPFLVPYITFYDSWQKGENEHSESEITCKFSEETAKKQIELQALTALKLTARQLDHDGEKVRLSNYVVHQTADKDSPNSIDLTFSRFPVKYSDFCKLATHIDTTSKSDPSRTYRELLLPKSISRKHLPDLPNTCGVGLFLIASSGTSLDRKEKKKIITSRQSATQTFSANLYSYAASGSMDFPKLKECPNPFKDVSREAMQEINFLVDRDRLKLVGVGFDTRELYVQFSFTQETDMTVEEIILKAHHSFHKYEWDIIDAVDFELDTLLDSLIDNPWEPCAAATLITLCVKEFGYEPVRDGLSNRVSKKIESVSVPKTH